jgi:MFS superfamily sulfate permease-like transporter
LSLIGIRNLISIQQPMPHQVWAILLVIILLLGILYVLRKPLERHAGKIWTGLLALFLLLVGVLYFGPELSSSHDAQSSVPKESPSQKVSSPPDHLMDTPPAEVQRAKARDW